MISQEVTRPDQQKDELGTGLNGMNFFFNAFFQTVLFFITFLGHIEVERKPSQSRK